MAKIKHMQDDFGSPLHSAQPPGPKFPAAPVQKGLAKDKGRYRILSGYGAAYLGQQDGEPQFGHDDQNQKTYKTEAAAKGIISKYHLEECSPELID